MRRYTLKQLVSFLEVANVGSVSRAAEKLHVTQPAVSMQLHQLEDAISVPLVEQRGRNIYLTEAGREFAQLAQAAVSQLVELDAAMAARRGLAKGRLDLAIVSTTKYFVPRLLMHFKRRAPGVEIALSIHNREGILNALARNEIDLAIMGRVPDTLSCDALPFASNPLGVVAAPTHALSRRKMLTVCELADASFLVREAGSGTRAAMERFFAEHDTAPRIAMEMPSNETIKQAVMAEMGLAFISLRTVRRELAAGHLALLDVRGLPLIRHWHVAHLTGKHLSPAAAAFRSFLVDEGAQLIEHWA